MIYFRGILSAAGGGCYEAGGGYLLRGPARPDPVQPSGPVPGLVRHPLTPQGEAAARQLGRGLRDRSFTAAYCSDSGRAAATAALLLESQGQAGLPLRRDPRLREWCLGSLEGQPNRVFLRIMRDGFPPDAQPDRIQRHLPAITALVKANDESGWAEDFSAIEARLDAAFRDMAAAHPGGSVLVVSHALAIKSLVYHFAPARMAEAAFIANASVTLLTFEAGAFQVSAINDTRFLDAGAAAL